LCCGWWRPGSIGICLRLWCVSGLPIDFDDLSSIVIVGEIVWINVDVVRVGIVEKADCVDVVEARQESLADAVHAVHDAAVAGKNDGKAEIAVADEAGVVHDLAAGDRFCGVAVPVRLVEFADGGERDVLSRQCGGLLDETVDVPGPEALGRLAEMILGAHCFPGLDSKLGFDAI